MATGKTPANRQKTEPGTAKHKRPKHRHIIRWDTIDKVSKEEGIKLPYDKCGPLIAPSVTGNAIVQHLAKLRKRMEAEILENSESEGNKPRVTDKKGDGHETSDDSSTESYKPGSTTMDKLQTSKHSTTRNKKKNKKNKKEAAKSKKAKEKTPKPETDGRKDVDKVAQTSTAGRKRTAWWLDEDNSDTDDGEEYVAAESAFVSKEDKQIDKETGKSAEAHDSKKSDNEEHAGDPASVLAKNSESPDIPKQEGKTIGPISRTLQELFPPTTDAGETAQGGASQITDRTGGNCQIPLVGNDGMGHQHALHLNDAGVFGPVNSYYPTVNQGANWVNAQGYMQFPPNAYGQPSYSCDQNRIGYQISSINPLANEPLLVGVPPMSLNDPAQQSAPLQQYTQNDLVQDMEEMVEDNRLNLDVLYDWNEPWPQDRPNLTVSAQQPQHGSEQRVEEIEEDHRLDLDELYNQGLDQGPDQGPDDFHVEGWEYSRFDNLASDLPEDMSSEPLPEDK